MLKRIALISHLTLLVGCATPPVQGNKLTNYELRKRLGDDTQIVETQSVQIDDYQYHDYTTRKFFREIIHDPFSTPNMSQTILTTLDETYFKHLQPEDLLYKPVKTGKQISNKIEEWTKFKFEDWIIKSEITGDSIGISASKKF